MKQLILYLLVVTTFGASAQQWNGSSTNTGGIYRSGNIQAGGIWMGRYPTSLSGDPEPFQLSSGPGIGTHDLLIYGSQTSSTLNVRLYDGSLKMGPGANPNAEILNNGGAFFGGNVGIGTSSPTVPLEVSGAANWASVVLSNENLIGFRRSDGLLIYGIGHTDGEFVVGSSPNLGPIAGTPMHLATGGSYIKFSQGSDERMRISNEGYVGIGTASPTAPLEISGTANGVSVILGNENLMGFRRSDGLLIYGIGHVGDEFIVGSSPSLGPLAGTPLHLATGGAHIRFTQASEERMRIDDNGNVGIGTATPQSKLAVDGDIRAKKVKVLSNVNVPDYVFEPDYELRTLQEVKNYVTKNKHLPEIPSATEIEKDGIDLGEMDLKLLKKIEELTLYQIELLEKLEEQQRRISELERRVGDK